MDHEHFLPENFTISTITLINLFVHKRNKSINTNLSFRLESALQSESGQSESSIPKSDAVTLF